MKMNIIKDKNKFIRKLNEYRNVITMNELNGKLFVKYLGKLYKYLKLNRYFEPIALEWLKLLFASQFKFRDDIWHSIINKIYRIVLDILLIDDANLKFALEFAFIFTESGELAIIRHFTKELDKLERIFKEISKRVFDLGVFYYQWLLIKIVYGLVQFLGDHNAQIKFLQKIFPQDNYVQKLCTNIVNIEKGQFESTVRNLLNNFNRNYEICKSYAVLAKMITIGDHLFEKPEIYSNFWVDFNTAVMEISFFVGFDNMEGFNIVNIPINYIGDIIVERHQEETIIQLFLSSNSLPLEFGSNLNISGANIVTMYFENGQSISTLKEFIIPEYLNLVQEQKAESNTSSRTLINLETLARATDTESEPIESKHSAVIVDETEEDSVEESHQVGHVTNGIYESLTFPNMDEIDGKKVVQRVEPIRKKDFSETMLIPNSPSASQLPEMENRICVRRLRYREIYVDKIETPLNLQSKTLNSSKQNPHTQTSDLVELLLIKCDSKYQDDNAEKLKTERLNNWLAMTHQNMTQNYVKYRESFGDEDTTQYNSEAEHEIQLVHSQGRKRNYANRSEHALKDSTEFKKLDAEFRRQMHNVVEKLACDFVNVNPRKNELQNEVKRLKLEQRNNFVDGLHQIQNLTDSIETAENNFDGLYKKLMTKVSDQERRLSNYHASVAAHNDEMKELAAQKAKRINEMTNNIMVAATETEQTIWNGYIIQLTNHIKNTLLKTLY